MGTVWPWELCLGHRSAILRVIRVVRDVYSYVLAPLFSGLSGNCLSDAELLRLCEVAASQVGEGRFSTNTQKHNLARLTVLAAVVLAKAYIMAIEVQLLSMPSACWSSLTADSASMCDLKIATIELFLDIFSFVLLYWFYCR